MVKLVTVLERHVCKACGGAGSLPDGQTCKVCNGAGSVEVEVVR